jgi:DnaJ-domain-containing protein 1
MDDIKDKFMRTVRANLNGLLDRIREIDELGGIKTILEKGLNEGLETIGGAGAGLPATSRPQQKTIREYYANLEVEFGADMDTVKASYRNLMRRYHPDRYTNDPEMERMATELSQELTRAYQAVESYLKTGRY